MPSQNGAISTPAPAVATVDAIGNGRAFLGLALLLLAFGLLLSHGWAARPGGSVTSPSG